MYLLDTNVVSELRKAKAGKADKSLTAWAASVSPGSAERDALIAATALVHSMTVVTRNVADFEPTGVQILNPWSA